MLCIVSCSHRISGRRAPNDSNGRRNVPVFIDQASHSFRFNRRVLLAIRDTEIAAQHNVGSIDPRSVTIKHPV